MNYLMIMQQKNTYNFILWMILSVLTISAQNYKIVDTGQITFYNNNSIISAPTSGESFYGQDAQYSGNQPSYTNNEMALLQIMLPV